MVGACSRRISVFGVALLLSVLFLGVIAPAYAEEYVFILKWGSWGTGDGQFGNPWGVAVDASGNVYVADTGNHRVQKFNSSGGFITKWGSGGWGDGQFYHPVGVAFDASGNVYVGDYENHRVQKFNSSGGFILKWGSQGSGDGQFDFPNGVAVDASGNVYVGDELNHRVQKFDGSGGFITKWGSWGYGDGQFMGATGVAVDASGNVYVADYGNNRVQKFSGSGGFITKWGSLGSGDGQFNDPIGVAVDAFGNVYVADCRNDRVQKFGPLAPTIESSDAAGNVTNVFDIPDIMYVNGSGYSASTTYDLYIVEDQATWTDGMTIPTQVPGTATNVTSDASGNIPPSAVWNSSLTPGNYDIVVDVNGNGAYNVGVDALDDSDIEITAGFIVIPEFPLGIMTLASMIIALVAYIAIQKSGLGQKHFH